MSALDAAQYKALRERLDLTQEGLARLVGVSRRVIVSRENGNSPISIEASHALRWIVQIKPLIKKGAK